MSSQLARRRQASAGEQGLSMDVREEHSQRSSSGTHSTNNNNTAPAMEGPRGRLAEQRQSSFVHIRNMSHPLEKEDASIGEAGTFRGPALARRYVNTSRRNLMKQHAQQLSAKSLLSTGSGNGEQAPLMAASISIPEDRVSYQSDGRLPSHGSISLVSSAGGGGDDPITNDGEPQGPVNIWKNFLDIWIGKYISLCLLVIPVALVAKYQNWSATWVFWLNFFVMLPLASILGDFTEEAALHTNDVVGGLLNASFGNAVEVVVAVQALLANEIRVVQASLIGSIYSNLLLVLGCCFFFGGIKFQEQQFNSISATASMGLLALSSIAMVLPTPFAEYYELEDEHVLIISRLAASFLLFMYLQLIVFQLVTHKDVFNGKMDQDAVIGDNEEEDVDDEKPTIPMRMALLGLGLTTGAVTIFSDFLVSSIDEFCNESGVSRTFVGLIILPIVGNAVEHVTAVTVAMKNKMDLAMGVAVGSCTQISLFVVPLTVLVGWMADKPMTLNFPHFEIILYVLSIFTVSICLGTPRTNWLEGSLLITTYIMIAIGFWFEKVIS